MRPMEERTKLAFDFAAETTKQLITLSTGILALSVTFSKDVLQNVAGLGRWTLIIAWAIYLISITFGLSTLMALTGNLEPEPPAAGRTLSDASIRAPKIKKMSIVQVCSFLLATFVVLCAGLLTTCASERANPVKASFEAAVATQRELLGAVANRDLAALDTLLADGWVMREGDSIVLSKPQLLAVMRRPAGVGRVHLRGRLELRVVESVGIASGFADEEGRRKGASVISFTESYQYSQGRWKAMQLRIVRDST